MISNINIIIYIIYYILLYCRFELPAKNTKEKPAKMAGLNNFFFI